MEKTFSLYCMAGFIHEKFNTCNYYCLLIITINYYHLPDVAVIHKKDSTTEYKNISAILISRHRQ